MFNRHQCKTHEEWLMSNHYMCSCSHVEWAHHPNGQCAHCICRHYNGEVRPKTDHELRQESVRGTNT